MTPTGTGPVLRYAAWEGLEYNDLVKVEQPFTKTYRGLQWRFRAFAQHSISGKEWVEVYGGRRGYEHIHAFDPSKVTAIPKKRRRKTS